MKRFPIERDSTDFYFIAEIGTNFFEVSQKNQESVLTSARRMILEAKINGAHACKLQLFSADNLVHYQSHDYKFFKSHELKHDIAWELIKFCEENDLTLFFSFFDEKAVETFGDRVPMFKVASPDITNMRLIKTMAQFKKPMLVSTGASTYEEMMNACDWICEEGNENIVLMHCITEYPTERKNLNLSVIKKLREIFPYVIGYSDHSIIHYEEDVQHIIAAYLLGANIIEKHFSFSLGGNFLQNDHRHSITPSGLKYLVSAIKDCKKIMGNDEIRKIPFPPEFPVRLNGRRSFYAKTDIARGETIREDNVIALRPAVSSFTAEFYSYIIGKAVTKDIKCNESITRHDIC